MTFTVTKGHWTVVMTKCQQEVMWDLPNITITKSCNN